VLLDIERLSGEGLHDVDLTVRAGEVVGVAGALGSGREILPATIFGGAVGTAARFDVDGHPYAKRSPGRSIARGIAFVPGDRAKFGSVRPMSARENITLPELRSLTDRIGSVDTSRERRETGGLMAGYDVRPPRPEQVFALFSGGNQQKIVFAKWLRNKPVVLLLEEPTQGVDIGAKQTIYDAIDDAAREGVGVLVCSSEAKELVRLCDRVLVMRNGQVTAELSGSDLTETRLVLEGYGLAAGTDAAPITTEGAE
jgi:ABC-type sugar transport system ATPase subunit